MQRYDTNAYTIFKYVRFCNEHARTRLWQTILSSVSFCVVVAMRHTWRVFRSLWIFVISARALLDSTGHPCVCARARVQLFSWWMASRQFLCTGDTNIANKTMRHRLSWAEHITSSIHRSFAVQNQLLSIDSISSRVVLFNRRRLLH